MSVSSPTALLSASSRLRRAAAARNSMDAARCRCCTFSVGDRLMADGGGGGAGPGERDALDLDALAVSDRFRLFNFTRRDDHLAYLWVLRAMDRLRSVHQVQAHSDDVGSALAELADAYDE